MTIETAASAESAGPEEVAAKRRWWWPLIALLVAALVGASSAAGWWFFGRTHTSAEAAAHAELQSAQLALINAPGAHYTGQLHRLLIDPFGRRGAA
ncbi:hypothetical protein [Nocardia sp. NPDC006630]|uniref:hypothetical protein n=1 Tax=Nocardia sp. NPDC006630 TaxID=3157181 RepID=UPI0033A905A6